MMIVCKEGKSRRTLLYEDLVQGDVFIFMQPTATANEITLRIKTKDGYMTLSGIYHSHNSANLLKEVTRFPNACISPGKGEDKREE